MARTKQNQRSANRVDVPMGATGGRVPPSKTTVALLSTSVIAAVWAAAMLTPAGRIAYVYLFSYSEFYMGVLSLVSLSITVMLGLVATDRMVLSVRQRVLMQSAHRTTGVIAVSALFVHVMTKLAVQRIGVIDLFIPFLARNQTLYVGLGTTAGFFMVSVLWTGIIRARFAGRGKPWMWRSLHSVAYLSWPIALLHGLNAGRAAAGWVIVSYIVCVLFVLVALAVRLSVSLGRRKDFSSTSTGSFKPVGKLVPTVTAGAKSRVKRRPERDAEVEVAPISAHVVADRGNAPAAVVESWAPARDAAPATPRAERPSRPSQGERPERAERAERADRTERVDVGPVAPVSARPSRSPRDADEDDYRPRRSERRDIDDEPRRRYAEPEARYVDDEPTAPRRRYVDDDEPVAPRARRYVEPEARYDEATTRFEEVPAQRSRRRYAEDEESAAPRGRRREPEDPYAEEPVRRRYVDDEPVTPRSRSTEIERYSDVPRSRSPRYAEQDETVVSRGRRGSRYDEVPEPRSSRYVDDVEPAPRARERSPRPSARPEPTGYGDREDSGRHSRAGLLPPSDPWGADAGRDGNYLPPDDTPTLVDMASRRARRDPEAPRGASRGARRRARGGEDVVDDQYLRQLRGEAQ
jgi:hypothetical protein